VLQKRAKDVTKLVLPFEPTEVLTARCRHKAATRRFEYRTAIHFFPLGRHQDQRGTWATPMAAPPRNRAARRA
jgi:methylenetetrahydrofolate reductase (NADPH)